MPENERNGLSETLRNGFESMMAAAKGGADLLAITDRVRSVWDSLNGPGIT